MNESPCRKPDGPYLIESAPTTASRAVTRITYEISKRLCSPIAICSSAVSGYRSELRHMLDAEAIYLGVRK